MTSKESNLTFPKGKSTAMQLAGTDPSLLPVPKMHRLKKLPSNPALQNCVPDQFLAALLNVMEISCAEDTEVYKYWPEMFEEEEQ